MINIKNTLTNVKNTILYFKNGHWRLNNFNGKLLPSSTTTLSSLTTNIIAIGNFVNNIPAHRNLILDKKIVDVITHTYTFNIYPNHCKENLDSVEYPDIYSIPLVIKDENDNIFDARVMGGGVSNEYLNNMIGVDKFINSYTDIGRYDGMPTAASTALMVELPEDIKNYYTEEYITLVVKKYITLGVHPIIKYYTGSTLDTYGWLFA